MRPLLLALTLLSLGGGLAACDAVAGSDQAHITVRMKDAPFPFDSVDLVGVSVTRIDLRAAADSGDTGETVTLYDGDPIDLNLLDLRDGVDTVLTRRSIPAGTYSELRIFVADDATVVFKDGRTYDLKLPSAQQSGIKVLLGDMALEDEADVLIDFNVEDSFVTRGNPAAPGFQGFLFKPVLRVESLVVDGDDVTDQTGDSDAGGEG